MIISSQLAYADYYTQSLSLGGEKNEYSENYIKTTPDNEKNTPSAIVEYVQPVVYPVQYSPTQIIYRNNPYPYYNYPSTYFNYNKGGLSIGYNSNPSINPAPGPKPTPFPPQPINPVKPQPINPNGGMKVYKVGPSYGRDETPSLLYNSQMTPYNGMHPHY